MSSLRRALGNGSVMLISQVATWTLTVTLTAALGRSLGDAGFGNLYLAMSFGVIFGVLVEFGLDQQFVRSVARDRSLAGKYLVNSLGIKAVLALVAYSLVLVLASVLGYSAELRQTIAVYCLILLLNGVSTSLSAVYQASERMLHAAVGTILEKVVVTGLALLLLAQGYGITSMAAVFVIGAAASVCWKAIFVLRIVDVRVVPDRDTIWALVRAALPFFLYWALGSVYYRIDVVLLSKLTDATVVGWYGAAYKLFDTLVFLPGIISSAVMFPLLARLAGQSREALRMAATKGLNVMLLLGIPITTGLCVLAEPIIQFIYGRTEFLPAVPALRLLAVGLFVLYVNSILAVVLVSLNQERRMTVLAGLATVFNFSLNWLLIPRFQHIAAAGVTVATELFICCYLLYFVPKDVLARESLVTLSKAAIAGAIMALVLVALHGQPLAIMIPVGAAAYGSAILALRVIPREDLQLLRLAILGRRAGVLPPTEAAHA